MRIEKGKSGVIVWLRPVPGDENRFRREQVTPDTVTSSFGLQIGHHGELIFTKWVLNKIDDREFHDERLVKVFAPHAWESYEYVRLKCDTCRKVPETCGAGFGGDNGCYRYESVEE